MRNVTLSAIVVVALAAATPVLAGSAVALPQPQYGVPTSQYTPEIVEGPENVSGRGVAPVTRPGRLPTPPILFRHRVIPQIAR